MNTTTLKLTARGLTGPRWIKRLEKEKYNVSSWAKDILNNPDYKKHILKKNTKLSVAFISVKDTGKTYPTTQEIKDYAVKQGYEIPTAEVALLVREAISDEEMEKMGFWYISTLHESVKDSDGGPGVLGAHRYGGGRWAYAFWDRPGYGWNDDGAFAFLVPASNSKLSSTDTETLNPLNLTLGQGWKYQLGDMVRKIKGSEWVGIVVGFYSSSQTDRGYAVESRVHKGSVQIYPEASLEKI